MNYSNVEVIGRFSIRKSTLKHRVRALFHGLKLRRLVKSGNLVAVVGRTGTGKSFLLNTVFGKNRYSPLESEGVFASNIKLDIGQFKPGVIAIEETSCLDKQSLLDCSDELNRHGVIFSFQTVADIINSEVWLINPRIHVFYIGERDYLQSEHDQLNKLSNILNELAGNSPF